MRLKTFYTLTTGPERTDAYYSQDYEELKQVETLRDFSIRHFIGRGWQPIEGQPHKLIRSDGSTVEFSIFDEW